MLVLVGLNGRSITLSGVAAVVRRQTVTSSLIGDANHVVAMFDLLKQNKV